MAPLKRFVRRLLQTDSATVVYECRNCGVTLEDRHETCPECGADGVACYRLE